MKIKTEGDLTEAFIVPRFDAYTANEVDSALRELIMTGTKKIICDFSQTDYVASAGLRVLLSAAKSLHNSGGGIVLFSMKPQVYEVFEISGFTQIFKIFASKKEALECLK
jgi:anti-sigma B factor antagonist